ncbi:hypothetical protein K1T71_005532 [Dendrolimus kikuchii]|uniref:Uncharacterized protein n=1 Tax=Dendrolimus kikuchii TaxID=765133 RepID=A0ACC1D4H0_9NEOP|nr:hypothetical protein K1T71_005532 [Dendrolimus kikuchii]
MSSKHASVGASRAGVAGAPRVLVYVADPRQLEAGAAAPDPPAAAHPPSIQPPPAAHLDSVYLSDSLHHQLPFQRNPLYRAQHDQNDQRNLSNTVFYKPLNEHDSKLNTYGAIDGVTQQTEFYPSQQYPKESCLKISDRRQEKYNLSVKRDCTDQATSEFCSVETFQSGIPAEGVDIVSYQTKCSSSGSLDSSMPPMQSVAIHHGQNQYSESVTVHSAEGENCGDRELTVGKSFMNYQFLEQSVSHQSIVNQSISILNQQVGVSRAISSESENENAPQLIRTADGVVLAVVPAPMVAQPTDLPEANTSVHCDSPQTITVPLGWRRIITGTSVIYISPSGTALNTLTQLREYLQTAGTCKCGLPCPLRPETAFSFDSKVASKPYQPASGAELQKLCNHKRKLLATLQACAQPPATLPPQNIEQKKVANNDVGAAKKKMKKRHGFPGNVSVPQVMVQKERPLNEFKSQDVEPNREISTGIIPQRLNNNQLCVPNFVTVQPNMVNSVSQDNDVKQETQIQRSSHYLTVHSGWISQHLENLETGQKTNQPLTGLVNTGMNVGMPVLGMNGQIIGVNTGVAKQASALNTKNSSGIHPQSNKELEQKEERKNVGQQSVLQSMKYPLKEEESQIYCGLNQPLTPEVMQKINEQQQIFIQQNQKQIEMAMKGLRTQLAENVSQNKPQNLSQYVPQAQLVIQNGAVVKTNPAKTPPWQVKRCDSNSGNPVASPNSKLQKNDNLDFEESNTNISEDSSSSYSSSNEQIICSRVPPLPQHYPMVGHQWANVDANKKKSKGKSSKKKANLTENKVISLGNNNMRVLQDPKGKSSSEELQTSNVPSFMDDPNGYLAQQTMLLNSTISRQVGINSSYDNFQLESHTSQNYNAQNQIEKFKAMNKSCEAMNIYKHNISNSALSPNTAPDSSVLSDKNVDNSMNQCCKGCNMSTKHNGPEFQDNLLRMKYMKHNIYKMDLDSSSTICSPKNTFDDNPVTSSTFTERGSMMGDNCGPIQAGVVSTSNVTQADTLQPPEPSPTLSNSSRNTDTPHSNGSNSSQMQSNCTYPMQSPAYLTSYRENYNSNPSTPGSIQAYPYNAPGPPTSQSITGTQMMHFISNHNVNKNLMEVDNISMVGVKPGLKAPQDTFRFEPKRRMENLMPGYCPPPHLGGGPAHSLIQTCYVQTYVTTMASGFTVTRDTVTSVLAGKANTATTSINASQANYVRPPPPPSINLATSYAIPNNQPDPFINSVNLPTSYPLHIAGTTAQNMISKSPLEMVQNVIGNLPTKAESTGVQMIQNVSKRSANPGQILISSTGQIIVSNNQMPPPPPKTTTMMANMQISNSVTNVSASVTQVVPPMVNQPTVVVNTLPAPFVIQPSMMAVDGQVVQQNTVLPQMIPGGILSGQSPNESSRQIDVKAQQNFVQGVAMLSPESLKKRNKKKKNQPTNISNVLQITAPQQNPNNVMVHHSSPQHNSSPQFSPRGFQLSPNNNISPTPMLQALTIVPGKSGTPAHIVMNGHGGANNYGSQQIIANTSPSQQINLLQPVNLINNASGVMSNFPAFQQFIVPNLGGMVMTADGAIIQDNSTGMPMQLQLQTVNGQNVLTPVQGASVFPGANGGVVVRAQGAQGKLLQSPHSPQAQFLSPTGQLMVNGPGFGGQLSPLLANLSPTGVAFNTPTQVRASGVQPQEFIHANQAGQALVVPLSPKRSGIAAPTRAGSTFVQQNTTIVQQQTTLVSNATAAPPPQPLTNDPTPRVSLEAPKLLFNELRPVAPPILGDTKDERRTITSYDRGRAFNVEAKLESGSEYGKRPSEFLPADARAAFEAQIRHSVSTQTLVQQQQQRKSPSDGNGCGSGGSGGGSGASPPDTTTLSPLGPLETSPLPRAGAPRPLSVQPHLADTTTKSPEPIDNNSSAMVQCVSSSEQDMAESREHAWPAPRADYSSDVDTQCMVPNMSMMRSHRVHNPVESTDMQYGQAMNNQMNSHHLSMSTNFYDRAHSYKRKNEFGDSSTFRSEKIMRTNNYNSHSFPKESGYRPMSMNVPEKAQTRHYQPSGTMAETSGLSKIFDRNNLGSGDDRKSSESESEREGDEDCEGVGGNGESGVRKFRAGEVVWGPHKGHASWPGKVEACRGHGRVTVRWFGGERARALLHASRLLTLSEGLEAHHAARTKHRKSRKLNTLLENAIQEAMAELDKKSEGTDARVDGTRVDDPEDDPNNFDTPKTSRKNDKLRIKDKHKRNAAKIASNQSKSGDGTRLRSSR